MAQIHLSCPIPHWGYVSLSVPHWVHDRDPPVLHHTPLGTCITEHPLQGTWHRSASPPPSPTGANGHRVFPTGYMAQIHLSCPIPHWGYVSLSVPHWVHDRDPPVLPHTPLGTCITEHPPQGTWHRSTSPPPSPTGANGHRVFPTGYMQQILLSFPIPDWEQVSPSVLH